jgi:hypothetical protein
VDGVKNMSMSIETGKQILKTRLYSAENDDLIAQLRSLSLKALRTMYRPQAGLFCFTMRRTSSVIAAEGTSRRYTAIVMIGLAGEAQHEVASVLSGQSLGGLCERITKDVQTVTNLGDVALTLWAASAVGLTLTQRGKILSRLTELRPAEKAYPTVEVAWALTALCQDPEAAVGDLRKKLAERLISGFNPHTGVFPHVLPEGSGFRSHVSCFADMVYPIQALAVYHKVSGDKKAIDAAIRCADRICELQGPAGQWWWHYDRRTGKVVEGYPVYSVHQDAMAPMALFALQDAGGPDYSASVYKGLHWIAHAPEIDGPLIDAGAGVVWRKVTHREPGKLCRYLQAAASRLHPSLRVPGLNALFPPVAIDYECRPYHLGWLLHAFPENRACVDEVSHSN